MTLIEKKKKKKEIKEIKKNIQKLDNKKDFTTKKR